MSCSLLFALAFACGLGSFNTFGTVVAYVVELYGTSEDDAFRLALFKNVTEGSHRTAEMRNATLAHYEKRAAELEGEERALRAEAFLTHN